MVPCPSAVRRVCRVPARVARRRRLAGDPSAGCSVVSRTRACARGGRARCRCTRSRARRRHRLRPPFAVDPERRCPHPRALGQDAAGRAARRASRAGDGSGHGRQPRRPSDGRAASLPPARRTCPHNGFRTIHAVRRCRHRHGSCVHLRRRSDGKRRGSQPCSRDLRAGGRRRVGRVARSPGTGALLQRRARGRLGGGRAGARAPGVRATADRPRNRPDDARAGPPRPRASPRRSASTRRRRGR